MKIRHTILEFSNLNKVYGSIFRRNTIIYDEQRFISNFYTRFFDATIFEKIIITTVRKFKPEKYSVLLKSLQIEIERNIKLFNEKESFLKDINTKEICENFAKQYKQDIINQSEITLRFSRKYDEFNNALESIGFRHHTKNELNDLLGKHAIQKSLYKSEKKKLSDLYGRQKQLEREAYEYTKNIFESVFKLNNLLLGILNKYINESTYSNKALIKNGNYFNMGFSHALWKATNDKYFRDISETEFYNSINLLTKPIALSIKERQRVNVSYIIYQLFKNMNHEQKLLWKSHICVHLDIVDAINKRPSSVKSSAEVKNSNQEKFVDEIREIIDKYTISSP